MGQKEKRIDAEAGNKYYFFVEEEHSLDYPVRVSGTGFELIEANGSIKILSREQQLMDEISLAKEQNRLRKS